MRAVKVTRGFAGDQEDLLWSWPGRDRGFGLLSLDPARNLEGQFQRVAGRGIGMAGTFSGPDIREEKLQFFFKGFGFFDIDDLLNDLRAVLRKILQLCAP